MPFELQIVCELELMYSYLLYTRAMAMAQTTTESTRRVPPRVEKDRANLAKDHLESQVRVHLANLEKVRRSPERDLPSPAKAVAPMTLTATDTLRTVTVKTMDMVTLTVDQASLEKVRRSLARDLPSPARVAAPMTLTATDTLRTVTAKTMDMATLMVDQTTFRADLMTQL
jgi:uncharacterized membrane protein YqiK